MSSQFLLHEGLILAAAVIMLFGTKLCWSAPRHRMSVEEAVKDGHLSSEQARRRIQVMGWLGPAAITVGAALLAYALLR